ncbi:MAG: hypothetical protein GF364_14575 [Candidatus Lokiarchaeota archaeon]|nr:hypothetical protein [Candidatus Lokiarchaeota archaeon]
MSEKTTNNQIELNSGLKENEDRNMTMVLNLPKKIKNFLDELKSLLGLTDNTLIKIMLIRVYEQYRRYENKFIEDHKDLIVSLRGNKEPEIK